MTGTFQDGEYTKMYPEWINTTITESGPLTKYCYQGSGEEWSILHTQDLDNKTATRVEKAVAATFKEVKVSAKCLICDTEDMWCDGTSCTTFCCPHND